MRGYSLPCRWAYILHEYGSCSYTFRLPGVGSTAEVEAPIDWGSVEALPAPSEKCESLATTPRGRQVARVILQRQMLGLGRPFVGRGTLLLLNQLFQQDPGPPPPSTYSSTSESDKGEWWDDEDNDSSDGTTEGGRGNVLFVFSCKLYK